MPGSPARTVDDRAVLPAPVAPPQAALALGPGPGVPPAPGVVALPGDGATGRGHLVHELVGVDQAQGLGHLLLFLEQQLVELAAGPPVQLDPGGRQHRAGVLDGHRVDVVGQHRDGLHHGDQGGDVAQAAVGLLQVGLEQEADVAVGGVALGHLFGQHAEPRWLLADPPVTGPLQDGLGHLGLATDDPGVEQAEGHPQVLGRHVEDLGRLAHAVVEGDPLVPHRVPDAVGGGRDVLPALVDQHHVEVAERAELAPSVAADGHQGHAPGVAAGRLVEQAGEPLVGRRRVGPAEGVPSQVGPVDQLLASGPQGHRRNVPPWRPRFGLCRHYAGQMADDEGSGRSTLGTVALVVGVVVVVWLALGLLHVIASLVWGVLQVAGLIALALIVWWLFFKKKDD